MKADSMPKIKKFPATKQRRMDELLEKNSSGTITPREQERLETLVREAEQLMVANGRLLSDFAENHAPSPPPQAVPVTVWVSPGRAET